MTQPPEESPFKYGGADWSPDELADALAGRQRPKGSEPTKTTKPLLVDEDFFAQVNSPDKYGK